MTCTPLPGGLGWTCTRGSERRPAPCDVCGKRPHTKLCDFALAGSRTGSTCSRKLCDGCAVPVHNRFDGDGDLCPAHAARVKGVAKS